MKSRFLVIVVLMVLARAVSAQELPIVPVDRGRINGTWNLRIQWITCDDRMPQLLPTPALISFGGGGVVTELDSSIWCDIGHCTSLGVWRHIAGRRYASTYKRPRLNSDTGDSIGSTIVVSSILHRTDDTLSITDSLSFYDADGALTGTRCRTATGTRFTGEN